jgi:SH3-like domain-containing protein
VRPIILVVVALLVVSCASPPAPATAPSTPAPPLPRGAGDAPATLFVTASALNVRREASTNAPILTQVRRGTAVTVLESGESWARVRLADGTTGWVASQYLSADLNAPASTPRAGCQPDSDYAFIETPRLVFSDSNRHGLVIVEANVNASGTVTRTRVISNTTGDDSLGAIAEREIEGATFSPPIRNCSPRAFIFTYRRTF